MTIRPATHADVPALVTMGRAFLQATVYRSFLTEAPEQMARLCDTLIDGLGAILVSEQDGVIVGMIGLHCAPHFLSGDLAAGEVFWWVDPQHRGSGLRLLKAAEAWARDKGATTLQMIAPDARVEQLYDRLGYQPLERTYYRRLDGDSGVRRRAA